MSRKARNKNGEEIDDEVINEFLNAQNPKTRRTYTSIFRRVLEFSHGESGSDMLENVDQWSRRIMAFQQQLISEGYSLCTVENTTGALRGFFSYYRKPLDLSRADKRKLGRKARNSEDYSFSQEDVKKMSLVGDINEKYVLLCGVSFGLRAEDFSEITFGKYRLALESAKKESLSAPIPLGKVNTAKEEVTAYPFISSDALPIITAILDAHKTANDGERVFRSKSAQLTSTLQNLSVKAGIDTHGQSVRFHCCRKYLFDRLVSVSSTAKASQIIGHKVSGEISAYIGEGSLRSVYEKAQPSIVTTNGNVEVKSRVSQLEEENAQLKAKIAELETEKSQNEANFSKVFARLEALEAVEQKKPVKVEIS